VEHADIGVEWILGLGFLTQSYRVLQRRPGGLWYTQKLGKGKEGRGGNERERRGKGGCGKKEGVERNERRENGGGGEMKGGTPSALLDNI